MARWSRRREPRRPFGEPYMPEYMEGVNAEQWRLLVEHEYMYRSALETARRNVEAELARPREQALSNLGINAVASLVFGITAIALFAMGLGWWALSAVVLSVPALVLALYFTRRVLRPDQAVPRVRSNRGGGSVPG